MDLSKGWSEVNVGLGICMRGNFPNPKKQLYDHVLLNNCLSSLLLVEAHGGIRHAGH